MSLRDVMSRIEVSSSLKFIHPIVILLFNMNHIHELKKVTRTDFISSQFRIITTVVNRLIWKV